MATKARGFTTVELLVTMMIAAILIALAAPSFKRTIQSNNMSSAVNTFMTDMRYARSEAIRRGGRVILCRADPPDAAAPSCLTTTPAGSSGWSSGWIVFQDVDGDGTRSAGDVVLRVQGGLGGVDTIAEGTATNSTVFRFTATGRLTDTASAASVKFGGGNFDTSLQRVVCVSAGGRARIAGDGTSSCGSGSTIE